MDPLDLAAITFSTSIFVVYHLHFIYTLFRTPDNVLAGWNYQIKAKWVHETSKKKGGDILAVQTLRNWILASTFLATVSMTIAFGLLTFVVSVARVIPASASDTDLSGDSLVQSLVHDPLLTSKTVLIIAWNFLSFIGFSQAIRYFNHVGFAMGVPFLDNLTPDELSELESRDPNSESVIYETVEHIAALLNIGSRFFTLGNRAFYFSILYVFWYFGPWYLIVASIILLFIIWIGDQSLDTHSIRKRLKRKASMPGSTSVARLNDVDKMA